MSNTKNILVCGERAIDSFCYYDVNRLSPEGPWPVLTLNHEIQNPGMAANVVANLKSLKGDYDLNVHFLCPFTTITKTRLVDIKTNHHFLRIDKNDLIPEEEVLHSREQLINYLNSYNINFKKLDAIVISSYKNFLTKSFIYDVTQMAKLYDIPVFMDCKFDLGEWSKDVFCVKINLKEYASNFDKGVNAKKFCKNLIVTNGETGSEIINDKDTESFKVKTVNKNPFSSGAGDTFLANLVIKYLETKDLSLAAQAGTDAATFKCGYKGVIAVKREELEKWIKSYEA